MTRKKERIKNGKTGGVWNEMRGGRTKRRTEKLMRGGRMKSEEDLTRGG